jgi:hypothetical protein
VHAYSLGAAYVTGEENIKGRLEPAKLADIAILSSDLFRIAPRDSLSGQIGARVDEEIVKLTEHGFFGARQLSSDPTPSVAVTAHSEGTMIRPGNISISPVVLTLPSSCF